MTGWTCKPTRGNLPVAVSDTPNASTTLLGTVGRAVGLRKALDMRLEALGLTMGDVAADLGVSRQYLGRVTSGGTTMSFDLYTRLCARIGIEPTECATLTEQAKTLIRKL